MTRSQAAYIRAVRRALDKAGRADALNVPRALRSYDKWETARAAAEKLIDGYNPEFLGAKPVRSQHNAAA